VGARRPPRLLAKTLAVTFGTVAALLVVVFAVVYFTVRDQVRATVTTNLESSQRLFAALESRRQRELHAQAATLAENPTLKAALETYVAESRASRDPELHTQLLNTIANEVDKVAAQIEADAILVVDSRHATLAAAGRLADHWPRGRRVTLPSDQGGDTRFDGVSRVGDLVFRLVTAPLLVDDVQIGALYVATSLDHAYAESLKALSRTDVAIASDGTLIASTLLPEAAQQFERELRQRASTAGLGAAAAADALEGRADLGGEAHAFLRLVQIGSTSFFALGSIDRASGTAMREATRSLVLIALGATLLALLGSMRLARLLSEPIGELSASLEKMAAARGVEGRLPRTGSSVELDALTDTFNAMMASVAAAEAQTEAAYTGAIRALAAALDARDPYTAGHSERVSVLSVAIGRALKLPDDELEVLRLGALLHDIGKIGVPDDILRKPGALTPAEYDAIKEHPVLGARILRSVPFLARHLPIVELHHERPDGRGYPKGLRDDDIPLAARIVHVADAYDAITSARAYRRARPSGEALRELWRAAGTEFHAEIVSALASALPDVMTANEPAYEALGSRA
jgi:putative nucleotidyltransferase with HDIG domain